MDNTVTVPMALVADRSLPRGAIRAYAALLSHWNRDGYVYVPHATLRSELGITERQLHRDISALIDGGYIRAIMAGRGQAKTYLPSVTRQILQS